MSKVQVDKVVNLSDDGAPQLTYGAELPVGYGLTGAGGLNITGVVTAASAVFSGNVTIGGTLTYEDVTNIDVVGVSTFAGRMNVNSTIEANEGINVTAGVGTFAGNVSIADKIIHTGDTNTAIRFPAGDEIQFETGGSTRLHIGSGNITQTIDTDGEGLIITTGSADMKPMVTGNSNRGAENNTIFGISGKWNNTEVGRIAFEAGADTTNKDDGKVKVYTRVSGGSLTSRLLIDSVGQIQLNTDGSQTASNISVGAGADLKLYHDGSDSYIRNISNTDLRIQNIGNAGIDIYNQNSYPITFTTNGSERGRLDADGRLLLGQTSADTDMGSNLQVAGSSYAASGILQARTTADGNGPALDFIKSRNTTWGSHTIVQDGDELGRIYFRGDDGVNYSGAAAAIFGEIDGTPGANDLPGRLLFYTSADGADSPTERVRITSAGRVGINETSPDNMLHVRNDNSAAAKIGGEGGSAYYMEIGQLASSGSPGFNATGSTTSMLFKLNGSEKLRIDSSGRLLLGLTSARSVGDVTSISQIEGTSFANSSLSLMANAGASAGNQVHITLGKSRGTSDGSSTVVASGDGLGLIQWAGADGTDCNTVAAKIHAFVDGTPGSNDMPGRIGFYTTPDGASSPTERMRIDNQGRALFNTTVNDPADDGGSSNTGTTISEDGYVSSSRSAGASGKFGRVDNDGIIVNLYQDGTAEGNISVSGSTVSYNGGHLSRWSQLVGISTNVKSDRPTIYQGTVMSNLDAMCEWTGETNQQLNKTKVSDTVSDKDVAGVFWAWDDDDDVYTNDFYIAMTGDMVIRVGAATTITRGDLLESAGDGTAKPQSDDIVRSKTVAKITSTTSTATYSDGSKAYPCVLMAC
jgi:hypothetical protein